MLFKSDKISQISHEKFSNFTRTTLLRFVESERRNARSVIHVIHAITTNHTMSHMFLYNSTFSCYYYTCSYVLSSWDEKWAMKILISTLKRS